MTTRAVGMGGVRDSKRDERMEIEKGVDCRDDGCRFDIKIGEHSACDVVLKFSLQFKRRDRENGILPGHQVITSKNTG